MFVTFLTRVVVKNDVCHSMASDTSTFDTKWYKHAGEVIPKEAYALRT